MGLCSLTGGLISMTTYVFNFFSHFVNVGIRYWIFTVFFWSGYLKLQTWEQTLFLFKHEYDVKLLPLPPALAEKYQYQSPDFPAEWAAYAGTAAEIVLPILILIGFGARLPAFALFVFNYVAVTSYPFLWTADGAAGYQNHILWGVLIGYIAFAGPGKISLDQLFKLKCSNYKY